MPKFEQDKIQKDKIQIAKITVTKKLMQQNTNGTKYKQKNRTKCKNAKIQT